MPAAADAVPSAPVQVALATVPASKSTSSARNRTTQAKTSPCRTLAVKNRALAQPRRVPKTVWTARTASAPPSVRNARLVVVVLQKKPARAPVRSPAAAAPSNEQGALRHKEASLFLSSCHPEDAILLPEDGILRLPPSP
ncbi:hypothetical protein FHG87_014459 [Trinorchestia longiramus]|nr:hypothetical protein FHG87_014459 [Trinorchestia longiramus]